MPTVSPRSGYEVDLLLIYLEKSREFEGLLPQETQREIAKGDQGLACLVALRLLAEDYLYRR